MERPWLHAYPAGVPATIDLPRDATVVSLFAHACTHYPQREAFACGDAVLDYRTLDEQAAALATWLIAREVVQGARVALMLPNVLAFPVALLGALRAGCVVVGINPMYTADELRHVLRDSGAETIVVFDAAAPTLQQVLGELPLRQVIVVPGALAAAPPLPCAWLSWQAVLQAGAAAPPAQRKVGPDDLAFLQYTGGTTGPAKGAMLRHRNVAANVAQGAAWLAPLRRRRAAQDAPVVAMAALPVYHIFALTACLLMSVDCGGLCVLVPDARDTQSLVRELARRPVNLMPGVNTLYASLLQADGFARLDFSAFWGGNGGAMPMREEVVRGWHTVTGTRLIEGYGLSEASPSVSCNPADEEGRAGSVGLPLPSTDVVIRDAQGADLPIGEAGEVCVRGPQVMAGYWRNPEETAAVLDPDGFLRTGDIGVLDAQGYLRLLDRKRDMILVSGFNVFPGEVEAIALRHPGVREAAAVGLPDAHSGEVVGLFVVPHAAPAQVDEAELNRLCRASLAPYKCPRRIVFVDSLPKNALGKLMRHVLRQAGDAPRAAG